MVYHIFQASMQQRGKNIATREQIEEVPVCHSIIDLWNLLNPDVGQYRGVVFQLGLIDSTVYYYMEDKGAKPVGFIATAFDSIDQLKLALQYARDHYVIVD